MADLSGIRVESAVPVSKDTKSTGAIEFKRNIFLEGIKTKDTSVRMDERGVPRESDTGNEYVKIKPEVKREYTRFLDDYTQKLHKAFGENPSLLENGNHAQDKLLLDVLVDPKTGKPREDRMNDFLEKPEGWIITTMAMEHATTLRLFALGMHAENIPQGEKTQAGDEMIIRFGRNQGTLNKFWYDKVEPNIDRIGRVGHFLRATGITSVVGYAAIGGIGGSVVGAAVPSAIYASSRVVDSLMRDGVSLDLRRCTAAFQVISGDPKETAFLEAITGVKVSDFEVRNGRVEPIRGPQSSTTSYRDLESDIIGQISTRNDFYTNLGIAPEQIDALPEQFLYAYRGGKPEETGTVWASEIQKKFDKKGGITRGDITGNLKRYMGARREVMMKMVNEYLVREKLQESTGRPVKALTDKEKDFGPDGKYIKERKAKIQGEVTILGKDKTGLVTEQADLKAYQDAQASLENVRQELRNNGMTDPTPTGIDAEISSRKDRIGGAGLVPVAGSIAEKKNKLDGDQRDAENAVMATMPPSLTGRPAESWQEVRLRPIQAGFNRQRTALDAEEQKLNEEISKLQESKKKILNEEAKLKGTETTQKAEKLVSTLIKDYEDIRSWDALAGGITLTELDLRTQSFEEIVRRINQVHTARAGTASPEGWPESQNLREDLRLKVLNAMAEARAREISPTIGVPTPDFMTVTNPVIYNISENDLRASTDTEIHGLIATKAATLGIAPLTIDVVRDVIKEARGRLDARSQALNEKVGQVGEKVKQQEAILGTVDNSFSNEAAQISVARDVLTRYGEIASSGFHVANERKRYTETSAVNTTDASYTQAEKDAGGPKGYYELMDLMFDYKERPDKDEYFRKISRALPPQKFAGLLNEILRLSVAVPATGINVNDVLTRLDGRIKGGRISQLDTSYAFRQIIERLGKEALSLAA